jgi:DNA-binding MarR family transcriptional regulator
MTVTDLATKLGTMHPSVSRSISKLVKRNLIEGTESGRTTLYRINPRQEDHVKDIVMQHVKKSILEGSVSPRFLVLLDENDFRTKLFSELETRFGKEIEISQEASTPGRYLDHKFDILLRVRKGKIGIEVTHSSKIEQLFQLMGRWADLHGTDFELIIVVVLGGLKQPVRSFFEETGKEHMPPVRTILVEIPPGTGQKGRDTAAKATAQKISDWLKPRGS